MQKHAAEKCHGVGEGDSWIVSSASVDPRILGKGDQSDGR